MSFIELDRNFFRISEESAAAEDFETRLAYGWIDPTGWEKILQQPRTVIIAEAGAGKTEEIKRQTLKLRSEGKAAFFIRLEFLREDIASAFEGGEFGEYDEFERWKSSGEIAWFFLDSVDEAKLKDPRDFELGLRKFNAALGLQREQAHIVITSRLTWEPQTELELVRTRLPYSSKRQAKEPEESGADLAESISKVILDAEKPNDGKPELTVFSLAPLNEKRIKIFAQARHVQNIHDFLEALSRSDSTAFAARPKDLDDLVQYWNDHKRIGSALELAQDSIERRIDEASTNRATLKPLAKKRALDGASRIAAATSLTPWSRITVPDQQSAQDGVDLSELLPDWTFNERKTLLDRAIFDEAVYGLVRFHHRSVREFLAARWFLKLLEKGSRRQVTDLFFRERYEVSVTTLSLRPILPWIAIHDDQFRERALQTAPEVLLQGGDSSQFPLQTRQSILRRICRKLSESEAYRESFDVATIQRFAKADLEPTVLRLLQDHPHHREIQSLLLRLVWQGRYSSCANIALSLATNTELDRYTRIYAIRALQAAGSLEQIERLIAHFSENEAETDYHIVFELTEAFFPDMISIDQLFRMLQRIRSERTANSYALSRNVKEIVKPMPDNSLEQLVTGMIGMLFREPYVEQYDGRISRDYNWLGRAASLACSRLIKTKSSFMLSEDALSLLSWLARLHVRDDYYFDDKDRLPNLVPQWEQLNHALFWYEIERRRSKDGELTRFHHGLLWQSYVSADTITLEDAIRWIDEKPLQDDKLVALTLAFHKYADSGRQRKTRERLKKLVGNDPVLSERLRTLLNPPPLSAKEKKSRRRHRGFEARQKKWSEKQKQDAQKSRCYIAKHIDLVSDSSHACEDKFHPSQRYLYDQMRKLGERDGSLAQANWRDLISDQREAVATIYREFLIACSRHFRPVMRSEGVENPNKLTYGQMFGLSGLEIEAGEVRDWEDTLTQPEATHIVRYSLMDLNGVPSWLQKFYCVYPDLVTSHFLREVRWELFEYEGEEECHYVLDKLIYHCDWLHSALAPSVFQLLLENDIRNVAQLEKALQIAISPNELDQQDLAELAERRSRQSVGDIAAIWFAVWASAAPKSAIAELSSRLEQISDPEVATQLAMKFVVTLSGSSRHERSIEFGDTYRQPDHLAELFLLIHRYVRREDDLDRAGGGVYSPGLRDGAQDARDALFNQLAEIPGKAAYLAIKCVVEEHPFEPAREWMSRYLVARAETDADIASWTAADVVSFEQDAEYQPRTAKQLFDLTLSRLEDLKDWLENGDDSAAATWQLESRETRLRILIANWLRDRAQSRYSIHQEEEQADSKRPDIRIHCGSVDAPIPIELKIADNWSGADLFERLENQLCNDYLRDFRTRCGAFLLGYRGKKAIWQHPVSKECLKFQQLVEALSDHASDHIKNRPGINDMKVVGIDLTKRFRPKRQSRSVF